MRENLARPMGLPADDPRVGRAARRAFRNYARYLVDVMRLAGHSADEVGELVTIENIEILHDARAAGKGVLLCTVHVGGMDLISPGLVRYGQELHVVADDTTYGRLYEYLKAIRARHGLTLVGWRNLRGLFRALKRGENLVLFCDGGYRAGRRAGRVPGRGDHLPGRSGHHLRALRRADAAGRLPAHRRRSLQRASGLPLIWAASDEPREIQRATQELADALGSVIARGPRPVVHVPPDLAADRRGARSERGRPSRPRGAARTGPGSAPEPCEGCLLRAGLWLADLIARSLPSRAAYALADLLGRTWHRFAPRRRALVDRVADPGLRGDRAPHRSAPRCAAS